MKIKKHTFEGFEICVFDEFEVVIGVETMTGVHLSNPEDRRGHFSRALPQKLSFVFALRPTITNFNS